MPKPAPRPLADLTEAEFNTWLKEQSAATPPPTDTLDVTDEQFRAWLRKRHVVLTPTHRTITDFPPEEFDSWLTGYRAGRRSMSPLRTEPSTTQLAVEALTAEVAALNKLARAQDQTLLVMAHRITELQKLVSPQAGFATRQS
jgi:hypothetical protein